MPVVSHIGRSIAFDDHGRQKLPWAGPILLPAKPIINILTPEGTNGVAGEHVGEQASSTSEVNGRKLINYLYLT
jgi:hypothetical protein